MMPYISYFQQGGAKCSLCGSDGTNKSTCPCNPNATKLTPNFIRNGTQLNCCVNETDVILGKPF